LFSFCILSILSVTLLSDIPHIYTIACIGP